MRKFFRGWRRKAGLVTLAMALLLAMLWMRSRVVCDDWMFAIGDRQQDLLSFDGRILWGSWTYPDSPEYDWACIPLTLTSSETLSKTFDATLDDPNYRLTKRTIPYWPLVLPLTLLSAWLLLTKPRSAKSVKESTSVVSDVASDSQPGPR